MEKLAGNTVKSIVLRLNSEKIVDFADNVVRRDQRHCFGVPHALTPAKVGNALAEITLHGVGITIDAQVTGQVGARAVRIRRGIQPDDRGAGGGGHVCRTGVRADDDVGGGDQGEQLLQ